MTAAEIVSKARQDGYSLGAVNGRLRVQPRPKPELRDLLHECWVEVLSCLQSEVAPKTAPEPRCPRHVGNEVDNGGCGACAVLRTEERDGVRFVVNPQTRAVSEQYRWADGTWSILPESVKRANGSWGWSDGRSLLTDPPPGGNGR